MRRYVAEGFGTFFMVLCGTGTIALAGLAPSQALGSLAAGLVFGLSVAAMIYLIGEVSGGHINPAVTAGFLVAKRFPREHLAAHVASQCVGAILGAGVVAIVAHSSPQALGRAEMHHFGANGWSWGLHVPWWAAFVTELAASFAFVSVFLVVRHESRKSQLDGLFIGMTVAALHIAFGPVTGPSLNPARSLGPALFAGWDAIDQLWLYILAPVAGGALAGATTKAFLGSKGEKKPKEGSGGD
ncbi:MIP/aquaporin family protein [Jiella sp. M17.18]|uniref:MIP/aquaporin family protein n=1 Tax=Jiella sp. M17.18 TaxID=3234247 RepID=UPI0034DE474B